MQRQNGRGRGFTLVEVIVTLVILAILAAIMIPAMTGWIDKAKQKRLIVACRTCVIAAQTIASEQYGELGAVNIHVTPDETLALAGLTGMGSVNTINIENATATVLHLRYTEAASGENVLYCRTASCHAEHFNFGAGITDSGTDWVSQITNAIIAKEAQDRNIDSGAPIDFTTKQYGGWTKKLIDQMTTALGKNAATALAIDNVQSWAVRTSGKSPDKTTNILLSDQSIDSAKVGDRVRTIVYNPGERTYSVGYATVSSNTVKDKAQKVYTYQTLGKSKDSLDQYFEQKEACSSYEDALSKLASMPLQP